MTRTGRIVLAAAIAASSILFLGASRSPAAEAPTACAYLSNTMKAQPAGAVFLASFPTAKADALKNVAFLYDNAVAVAALIGCGQAKTAARIGDAMLAALDRDRYFHDGRLRNGYLAGPVGRAGALKLGGWWDGKQNLWAEDGYQVGSDSGNMAWAMLALLSLDRATGDHRYRDGAARIGGWVKQWRSKEGPGGYTGGAFSNEMTPVIETWKSTEHNTDLFAAFSGLARATGDRTWQSEADAALSFVRAMWRPVCGCFAVGTGVDGKTLNLFLALDAQTWPLLAIPKAARQYKEAAAPAALRDGEGFAYSEAKDGVWTEGTAQVALLLSLSGRNADAQRLLKALEAMRTPDGSYLAANTRELPTGFMLETDPKKPRQYFRIEHLAAVAWVALAQRRFNPFTGTKALP